MTARRLILGALLVAAVGGVLVITLSGGGASGQGPEDTPDLEPGVAVRVSASPSEVSVPTMLKRLAAASGPGSAAVSRAISEVERGLGAQDLAFARRLLSRAAWISFSLERSCPPPALLGCHPTLRVCAKFDQAPGAPWSAGLPAVVRSTLRAAGLRRLAFRGDSVHSDEEVLARWRLDGDTLELTTGWTKLGHCAIPPAERSPQLQVSSDRQELAQIF